MKIILDTNVFISGIFFTGPLNDYMQTELILTRFSENDNPVHTSVSKS